jgi:cell division protein FtsN
LTHDFAKKSPPPPTSRLSGWVWLFTGLVTGIFAAFIYYLADIAPEAEEFTRQLTEKVKQANELPKQSSSPKQETQATTDAPAGPRFTFYDELAKLKVIPPEVEKMLPRTLKKNEKKTQASPSSQTQSSATTNNKQPAVTHYLLQTDSFQNHSDADRRRAELILMGMDTNIQTTTLANGQTWHRVIVGPFIGKQALHKAQKQLAQLNINAAIRKIN